MCLSFQVLHNEMSAELYANLFNIKVLQSAHALNVPCTPFLSVLHTIQRGAYIYSI